MIRGRVIVCFASDWDYDPTSKHHLMTELSVHNKIVWVNYRGSRRPSISKSDAKDVLSVLRGVMRGVRRISDSMVQVTPLLVPGASSTIIRALNRHLLVLQIRRAIKRATNRRKMPLQVWSFAPDVPDLIGRFSEECFLYYCVDEHAKFDGYDEDQITRLEVQTLMRSDVVVASSEQLLESKQRVRPDAALVRHGVAYDHFAAAWRNRLGAPGDVAGIRGPIFGFFGLLHHWIDVSLIAKVAMQRPNYSFVLIGEVKTDVSVLTKLSNVHLMGRRSFDSLPAYCAAFDVALLPFCVTEMTRNVSPIKLYEYLAAGLSVVATPLPDAKRFPGPIRIAGEADSFALACDEALLHTGPGERARISNCVRNESWASRAEAVSKLIEERVLVVRAREAARRLLHMPSGRARTSQVVPVAAPS